MRGDDSDICPVDGCRADIADSRLVAVGHALRAGSQAGDDIGSLVGRDVGQPVERCRRYPGVFQRRAGRRLARPRSGLYVAWD